MCCLSLLHSVFWPAFPSLGVNKEMQMFHRERSLDQPQLDILYSEAQIAARVAELGAQITKDYQGQSILLLGVLKGAAIFLSDLARAIDLECTFDFIATSSYGKG